VASRVRNIGKEAGLSINCSTKWEKNNEIVVRI
jgi:hypothetical protein